MSLAIYVRVSTQRQAHAQTIEQQLDRLQAHIRNQGWELSVANTLRDDGYSGASVSRPGLDRLRDAVGAAEVERVADADRECFAGCGRCRPCGRRGGGRVTAFRRGTDRPPG